MARFDAMLFGDVLDCSPRAATVEERRVPALLRAIEAFGQH
jgi:hypothetical protein